ncbi:MAG: cyclic nucleotide-binding domain-containing protein [Planctomycetota bacterium]|nr:cyclic nucleotide-binding domain-containing protein [Planctomycetota bacterium]MDE1889532.1 cyclic nucleotide-binding domain-containing protein [Planctomycetota bacterium]MDE2217046.1 cyclic nucleotide-binding domain-containing protein [Planctomycetota bacterium]
MPEEGLLGRIYKDDEIIVKEGMQSRTMYVVQSGKVKIVKSDGDKEIILAVLNEGDIFGEMSLFDASPRSASVKAIGEARVLAIEHEGLLKRITMDPTLAFRIIKQMSQRIRNLNSKLSTAMRTITQVNNKLLLLNSENVTFRDRETKSSHVIDNIAQIQKELHKCNELFIQNESL